MKKVLLVLAGVVAVVLVFSAACLMIGIVAGPIVAANQAAEDTQAVLGTAQQLGSTSDTLLRYGSLMILTLF
jgi:hypothetical protein